jgi:hypothetical protein
MAIRFQLHKECIGMGTDTMGYSERENKFELIRVQFDIHKNEIIIFR